MIDKFAALPFKGKINLSNPQNTFLVLENWDNNHKLEYKMKRSYFGLEICKYGKGIGITKVYILSYFQARILLILDMN